MTAFFSKCMHATYNLPQYADENATYKQCKASVWLWLRVRLQFWVRVSISICTGVFFSTWPQSMLLMLCCCCCVSGAFI